MRIALIPGTTVADATWRRVLGSLSSSFRTFGHAVRILSPVPRADAGRFLSVGAETVDLGAPGRGAYARLIRELRASRPDLVQLQVSGTYRAWHAELARAAEELGFRLQLVFQDYAHPGLVPNGRARRARLRRLLARVDDVTAVSQWVRGALLRDAPGARVRVVPNGVDLPREVRPPGDYALCVGRDAAYKGNDLVVWAYASLPARDRPRRLLFAGTRSRSGGLEALAARLGADAVEHRGLLSPERTADLIAGCAFFVSAPRHESFGMAALEALAAGKAVLTTRVGGLTEFVRDGENGLLVERGDVEGLAHGMRRLTREPGLARRLGRAGRRDAALLSWDRAAEGYLKKESGKTAKRPRRVRKVRGRIQDRQPRRLAARRPRAHEA